VVVSLEASPSSGHRCRRLLEAFVRLVGTEGGSEQEGEMTNVICGRRFGNGSNRIGLLSLMFLEREFVVVVVVVVAVVIVKLVPLLQLVDKKKNLNFSTNSTPSMAPCAKSHSCRVQAQGGRSHHVNSWVVDA
jgi:hypothetical protein